MITRRENPGNVPTFFMLSCDIGCVIVLKRMGIIGHHPENQEKNS